MQLDIVKMKELEKEYSPSEWSIRFKDPSEVITNHIEIVTNESNECKKNIKYRENVAYGEGDNEKLDIYENHLSEDAPIFVYIHGGYWVQLSKDVSAYCVRPLVESGYRVIIVEYDLCPQITLEDLAEQIKKAGKFILNMAEENNAKSVSFCGHSAGAHLVSSMLNDKNFYNSLSGNQINLIKNVYLISGIYDLTEIQHLEATNPDNILSLNDKSVQKLSPIYQNYEHYSRRGIKFHIFVAEYESNVFKEQSKQFCDLLKNDGIINANYWLLEGLDHFNIVENLSDSKYIITKIILENISN
uniref:Putative kynurenine formamidase n=1 Tax=Corethrella appendiculata TaxID=1370023 RepID=U5ES04_9DIPT